VIVRRAFIDMTGNPAVVGKRRPVDRWLCDPCFHKVCSEQWGRGCVAGCVMSNRSNVMSECNGGIVNQFRMAPKRQRCRRPRNGLMPSSHEGSNYMRAKVSCATRRSTGCEKSALRVPQPVFPGHLVLLRIRFRWGRSVHCSGCRADRCLSPPGRARPQKVSGS
jgi:hypothetical protein